MSMSSVLLWAAVLSCLCNVQAQLVGTPPNCVSYTGDGRPMPEELLECTSFSKSLRISYGDYYAVPLLANVKSIAGDIHVDSSGALNYFEMPALEHVGGYIWMNHNLALLEVKFPHLRSIGANSSLTVRRLDVLEVFEAPALEIAGNIIFDYVPALAKLQFNSLQNVTNDLEFKYCKRMDTLEFPELRVVGGGLSWGKEALADDGQPVAVYSNLETLTLSSLRKAGALHFEFTRISKLWLPNLVNVTGRFRIWEDYMYQVDMPAVTFIGEFSIRCTSTKEINAAVLRATKGFHLDTRDLVTLESFPVLDMINYPSNVGLAVNSICCSDVKNFLRRIHSATKVEQCRCRKSC